MSLKTIIETTEISEREIDINSIQGKRSKKEFCKQFQKKKMQDDEKCDTIDDEFSDGEDDDDFYQFEI